MLTFSVVASTVPHVPIFPTANAQALDSSCVTYSTSTQTVTLKCGQATMSNIHNLLSNEGVLAQEPGKTWLLDADIVVKENARLEITSADTSWLKLENPHGIVAFGDVVVDSVKITSWNSLTETYALTDGETSRSYLAVWEGATGQMNITNSEIAYLGFAQGNKQGLAYYGGDNSIVLNNEIHHMWYGFFSDNVGYMRVENNRIHDNQYYGIDPHSNTHHMRILNNVVYSIANGIAIICSDQCHDILIEGNQVYGASVAGLMLNRDTTNSIVRNNIVRDGGGESAAISIDSSDANRIYNNTLSTGRYGIKIARDSANNFVFNNTLSDFKTYGVCMTDGSSQNIVRGNTIRDAGEFGICTISGSSRNEIYSNEITNAGSYAIYVRGNDAEENKFKFNLISDSGQNGIRVFENQGSLFEGNQVLGSTKADYSGAIAKISIYNTTFSSTYFDGRETEISIENRDSRAILADQRFEILVKEGGSVSASFHLEEGRRLILTTLPLIVTPNGSPASIVILDEIMGPDSVKLTWIEKTASIGENSTVTYRFEDLRPGTPVRVTANQDTVVADTAVGRDHYVEFVSTSKLDENIHTMSAIGIESGNTTGVPNLFDDKNANFSHTNYACELFQTRVHCDPLLGDFTSYTIEGRLKVIQPLTTSDAAYVEGKVGQAIKLSARYRESVEVMNTPALANNPFSFAFWMRNSDEAEPYGHIVSHLNFAGTAGWVVDMTSTMGSEPSIQRVLFGVTNTQGTMVAPREVEVPRGKFVHVAGTFDGSFVRLYVDGDLTGEAAFHGTFNPDPGAPLRIGSASYSTSTHRWSGIIDELVLFDKALSADEVSQLSRMTEILGELSGGGHITANWSFDNNFGDSSGQGNDGTLSTLLASMAFAKDGRLFFSEKNTGKIRIMKDEAIRDEPFAYLPDVYVSWEQGLLGLAIDPKFEENHYVYQYYVYMEPSTGNVYNKVVRFTEIDNKGTEMKVLLDKIPAVKGYHSGGALAFGPDDKLYITVGDATEHPFAQDPNVLIGKVLRIERDGSIPPDNPIPNSPVFTKGHRNSYGLAFDNNGTGIITENGESAYDEINIIIKGGNYGFPTYQPANIAPELADPSLSLLPARSYYDTVAPTQAIFYTGDKIPELKNRFIFGTFTGDIFALEIDPESKKVTAEERVDLFPTLFTPVIGIAQSPDGDIYYGSYSIFKLDSLDPSTRTVKSYPIRVAASQNVSLNNLVFNQDEKKITLDLTVNSPLDSSQSVSLKVPKELMDEFSEVISEIEGNQMKFTVTSGGGASSDGGYNIVSIELDAKKRDSQISALAVRVIPEFPIQTFALVGSFGLVIVMMILLKSKFSKGMSFGVL